MRTSHRGSLTACLLLSLSLLTASARGQASGSTGDDTLTLLQQDASGTGETSTGTESGGQPVTSGPAGPAMVTPTTIPPGETPGKESWRRGLPLVYYIFCSTGDDENFFYSLARGPSVPGNLAEADAAAALSASGLSGSYRIVRVQVSSVREYEQVLQQGMVPSRDRGARHVYTIDELVPQANSILGLTVISHAGQDGPFIPLVSGWGYQANYDFFRRDKQSGQANSFYNRLVYGARMRFAGCNTGTDYMWYESDDPSRKGLPSVAHAAAAILADKRIVTYGKHNSGGVDSTAYLYFACPAGKDYPVRYVKPKRDYSFGSTNAATQLRSVTIRYNGVHQRDAYLAWYAKRGIRVQVADERTSASGQSGTLVVMVPRAQWYTRHSAKPAILKAVVAAVAANPQISAGDIRDSLSAQGHEMSLIETLLPGFDQFIADGKLVRAIAESRAANGGQLDPDDFRLWAVLLRPDHHEWAYRADLCDDPNVAAVPFQE